MAEQSDRSLVECIASGDEQAFVELIRRYEHSLASLIRYTVGNPDDAQDVLQETLLDAWSGLGLLREPDRAGAWLLQVAKNRCRDFFRSRQRRDLPAEDVTLEASGKLLWIGSRRSDIISEIIDALDRAPQAEREAADLFYLQGFSISEIAKRHSCPEGTVKRRLHSARSFLRRELGVADDERRATMTAIRVGSKKQPFPQVRPEITITPLEVKIQPIDCRELRWWVVIPEVGSRGMGAEYRPPEWKLARAVEMRAVRPAKVHGIEGVEIDVAKWEKDSGWASWDVTYYGRLTDTKAQWLGEKRMEGDEVVIRTFLDEGFVWAYPEFDRKLEDGEVFRLQEDGTYVSTRDLRGSEEQGAGVFLLTIGERTFTALRILAVEDALDNPDCAVRENFVSTEGRTILIRHYCRRETVERLGFAYDSEKTITINGVTFVCIGDSLTDAAVG